MVDRFQVPLHVFTIQIDVATRLQEVKPRRKEDAVDMAHLSRKRGRQSPASLRTSLELEAPRRGNKKGWRCQ